MNVQCGSCPAKYAVPDDKVLGRKVRITCKRCGAAIIVDGTASAGAKSAHPAARSQVPAKVASTKSEAKAVAAAPRSGAAGSGALGSAATSTRPSAAARSALKQTMMGVAPPAPGSAAPSSALPGAPGTASAGPAQGSGATPSAARKAEAASAGGLADAADRDIKRTMIGGLDAPAARAGQPAAQSPSLAVPRVQPPAADSIQWTVAVTDEQHEEMPIPRVVELFAKGTINAETYIWKQGMEDWQMPFDIPEIAAALAKQGIGPKATATAPKAPESGRATDKMPTAPPPATAKRAGVWREPGSWNDGVAWKEPPLAPGQEHHDVSFDDVTVALAAPQAEALLRDAELAAELDKDEPTAIFPGGPEAPPLSSPRPVLSVPRPAAGRPVPRPDPRPASDSAALAGHPTPPAIAIEGKPSAAQPAPAPQALAQPAPAQPAPAQPAPAQPAPAQPVPDSARASSLPASRRATPVERPRDLFGNAHRAGSEESQLQEDAAGSQKLIGERNESSVLFSLDKVVETEQDAQKQKQKQLEEELLGLTANPVEPGAAPAAPVIAPAAAIESPVAAPDPGAPVTGAPVTDAPMPVPDPAELPAPAVAASHATLAEPEEAPKQEGGSGWLWAFLLILLLAAAGAIVIFYLRPAALFGTPPPPSDTAGTALPIPPAPPTTLEPVVAPPEPSAAAVVEAGVPAASAATPPAPGARERVEPRATRQRGDRDDQTSRTRGRKRPDETSADPAAEEDTPPTSSPSTDRDAGP